MEAIFINKKIHLIEDLTVITVNVICPRRNIQNMLKTTKSKFISKKEIRLNFNHHAGQTFEVQILARFSNVKKFLKIQDVHNYSKSLNYDAYIDLISINGIGFGGFAAVTNKCFENIIVGLYSFGDCSRLVGNGNSYTSYFRINGHSVLRCNNDFTTNGRKRYIKTAKGWMSNRGF